MKSPLTTSSYSLGWTAAFYAEGRAAIYVNLQLRALVLLAGLGKKMFLLSLFLSFSFQFALNAMDVKTCWLRLPRAISSYCFIIL